MVLPLIVRMAGSGRRAATRLTRMATAEKAARLRAAAAAIRADAAPILAANAADLAAAAALSPAMHDRLRLDAGRVAAMADAIEAIAALPDPVGQVIDATVRPNGLALSRVRVPIGLIGIIYESRPNVTADAAALCMMSGNAVILRGGSEAVRSNHAIHAAFLDGWGDADLPGVAVQLLPQDRDLVGDMLAGSGRLDLIIPRGGKALVERVQREARVPVLAHLEGINHVYVHASADPDMAARVVIDAKMRRPAVCGAMETLLIDRGFPHIGALASRLADAGCTLICDHQDERLAPWNRLSPGRPRYDVEHLGPVATVATVPDLDGALAHIAMHGSGHTDAIVAADVDTAERFLAEVDSAIVLWNASTQFADGGEFGLGAEIGIATGRLHARGPVALEGLTTYKWVGRGTGQVRG